MLAFCRVVINCRSVDVGDCPFDQVGTNGRESRRRVRCMLFQALARIPHFSLSLFKLFTKPIWTELLPPPLPEPHQKPYTLLLSLDDLLVTSTWDVRRTRTISNNP